MRQQIQHREPNGRLQREAQSGPAQAKRLRDAALRKMEAPEWGTELGRLFLEHKVTAEEFEAGKRLAVIVKDYRAALGITALDIKVQDMNRGAKGSPPDFDSEAGRALTKAERMAVAKMHAAEQALRPTNAFRSVFRVAINDLAPLGTVDLKQLSTGLQALAAHFGLTGSRERGRPNVR